MVTVSVGFCKLCAHCDPRRTNDLGQVRCKRFSTYVSTDYRCDKYTTANELTVRLEPMSTAELRNSFIEKSEALLKKGW